MPKPITIQDVAEAWGAKPQADGSYPGGEYVRLGLPIMGGCEGCGATVACYNAYPSYSGYIRCSDCIGDNGYETVAEFETGPDDGEVRHDG